jgi:MFS family permease
MDMTKGSDSGINTRILSEKQRLSLLEQVNLNVFWIANQFHWQALLAVTIPSMVAHLLDPAQKSINLAIVVTAGTLVALVVNPLVGALSDYATFRLGRRRPFMIFGTVFNIIALLLFAFAPSWFSAGELLFTLALLFLFLQFSNNLANSPWSAIIADKVPQNQRGFSSGIYGLFSLLGTVVGSLVAGIILGGNLPLPVYRQAVVQVFFVIAIVQIVFVAYTVLTVKEVALPPERHVRLNPRLFAQQFFFKPSQYPDVSWVLLARFLVMMAIWSVYYFLLYYFDDVLGGLGVKTILLNTPFSGEQFNGVLFQPILLLMALPTSILAGWASDHWGRKGLVYISGVMMAIVCLIFIFLQNQYAALIAGAFFGIGYGAYTSVDWALMTDVLPPTDEAGKFMGIWSAVGILPQVVGITVGGVLLQLLQSVPHHFGYTVLLCLTFLYLLLGTSVIRRVKGTK